MDIKAMIQAVVCGNLELATKGQLIDSIEIANDAANLDGGAIDTLHALYEGGPLRDGDVPSKAGRDRLLDGGYAAKVVVDGEQGFNACTYKGAALLRARNAR